VLVGLMAYLMRQLHAVGPECGGTVDLPSENMRPCIRVTDVLISLHWLRVPQRIQHKLAVLTYKVLHGMALSCNLGPLVMVDEHSGLPV